MTGRRASTIGAFAAVLALVLLGMTPVSAARASSVTVTTTAAAAFKSNQVQLGSSVYPSASATMQEAWLAVRSTTSSLKCTYNGSWSCSAPTTTLRSAFATQTQSSTYKWVNSWTTSRCTVSKTTYYYHSFTAGRVYMSGTAFKTSSAVTSAKSLCS